MWRVYREALSENVGQLQYEQCDAVHGVSQSDTVSISCLWEIIPISGNQRLKGAVPEESG